MIYSIKYLVAPPLHNFFDEVYDKHYASSDQIWLHILLAIFQIQIYKLYFW